MWGRFVALAVVGFFISAPAESASVTAIDFKNGKTRLDLVGDIQPGDKQALTAAIQKANDASRLVATIRLNSPGGNILEAVEIAQVVRQAKIATSVLSGSTCASACFIIFAAGNQRYASYNAMIGVHGASDESGQETIESGAATVSMARIVRNLGVPEAIIGKMVVTPPTQMVWLGPDDLRSMGTTMFGKPQQVAEPAQSGAPTQQLANPAAPLSIAPQSQAARTPASWSYFIKEAAALSASQNGGTPMFSRSCQPELKICNTGLWFKGKDGSEMLIKQTSDTADKVISREVCSFNSFKDVRDCADWDSGQVHRDMKDAKGNWYKVE